MRTVFIVFSIVAVLGSLALALYLHPLFWILVGVIGVVVAIGIYDMTQPSHAIMRNFPLLGRGRYIMETARPGIRQYFIESDTDGTPINRMNRSLVYQRAKRQTDTTPFGTQKDVYAEGYEWVNHSIAALKHEDVEHEPRVLIGNSTCRQPYSCSILNVSAMSYGSLSSRAIEALNRGAKIGNFAHNTGEGGISSFHLSGGDLIYQIGTGYFGSRDEEGNFSWEQFEKRASEPTVKMIELKLSQGAKPGHGGILPAKKNTPEIAAIRGVKPGVDVNSPPYHSAFDSPKGLIEMITRMKEISGKPCGFKLCVGRKSEFLAICKAMVELDKYPDFISVDGGEGGTGAAPLEFTNSVGMPFREGLSFVYDSLVGFGIKQHIKIITSGKITSAFHIFRALALGADACYSARAMMLALGCIQALECNKNNCPTGVATQNPELIKGLVVKDKETRVANFHYQTINGFTELLAAAGMQRAEEINRTDVYRRVAMNKIRRYDEIYKPLTTGCLLKEETMPEKWKKYMNEANVETFAADYQL